MSQSVMYQQTCMTTGGMGAGATVTGGSCIGIGAGVGVRSAVLLPGLIILGAEAAGSSVKLTRRTTMGTVVTPAAVGPATPACNLYSTGVEFGQQAEANEGRKMVEEQGQAVVKSGLLRKIKIGRGTDVS